MIERKGSSADGGGIVIIIIFAIFMAGVWTGKQYTPEPEEIYIYESKQPMKTIFVKEINQRYEIKSYQTIVGDRDFIVYYWIEAADTMDGIVRTLHWTWREVTGP